MTKVRGVTGGEIEYMKVATGSSHPADRSLAHLCGGSNLHILNKQASHKAVLAATSIIPQIIALPFPPFENC
jgi:hypothetical protein